MGEYQLPQGHHLVQKRITKATHSINHTTACLKPSETGHPMEEEAVNLRLPRGPDLKAKNNLWMVKGRRRFGLDAMNNP